MFTPRSKICFVIVVALINFFKILTTWGCYFFSTLFFAVVVFASSIAVLGAVEQITINEADTRFFLTTSHSSNQTFLGAAYSFFF